MSDDDLMTLVLVGLGLLALYTSVLAGSPSVVDQLLPAPVAGGGGGVAPAPTGTTDPGVPAVTPIPVAPPVPVGASGGDMIDLASAQIVNSPDVRSWPITTSINHVVLGGNSTIIDFDKRVNPACQDVQGSCAGTGGTWPHQQAGIGGVQYTVWLFLYIGGQWVGSGFIQMWYDRKDCGDGCFDYVNNWYYSTRWAPMTGHRIQPGETIGFMVTPGNMRDNGGPWDIPERSNIVTVQAGDNVDVRF